MQTSAHQFKANARRNLDNPTLQQAMKKVPLKFMPARKAAVEEVGTETFEAIRQAGADIRAHTLAHLDLYLAQFEQTAQARGTHVHWAATAEDVPRIVLEIAQQANVKKIVKSKSMVSEECALNPVLQAAGLEVWETDLGEYILQLAQEPPSHIVAPVIHKTKDQVADLFAQHHQKPRQEEIAALCREAREVLRPHFLSAQMGISGANFLVAETGSTVIVTNEGNGRMATTLPRVHVAITGIEKVVPTLEDLSTLLRLLPRSATGQPITNYISMNTGLKGDEDSDGPQDSHVILLDNGRSRLLGSENRDMLRCIRCGACMNHCPVYQNIGGHSYGWVYPGPMGSVLTPSYLGLEKALDLPHASTFCGACASVCPVKIPIPDLLRNLRHEEVKKDLRPRAERVGLQVWQWFAERPWWYAHISRWVARHLARQGGGARLIHRLSLATGWTDSRDLPAPTGKTFRERYQKQHRG